MSTYVELQDRIADDINRDDLDSQIQQSILLAIQNYKLERFWFNESNATASTTVGSAEVAAPDDILKIDNLYIVISGRNLVLVPKTLDEVVSCRATTNGRPRAYCYYRNQFELDRPADDTYTLNLYYLKELEALSADADENGWTTDGEDLIVFHAEKKLYANVIKDQAKAAAAAVQEMSALTRLRDLARARTSTGYTKAHYL